VQAVSSVAVVGPAVGSTPSVLAPGVGYAVVDADRGVLRVEGGWSWPEPASVQVVYTQPVGQPPPADVTLAATIAVAAWFGPTLPSGTVSGGAGALVAAASGVKSYQVGGELRVEFADAASTSSASSAGGAGLSGPLPPAAVGLLVPYGYPPGGGLVFA
jgi:hypothetical protein